MLSWSTQHKDTSWSFKTSTKAIHQLRLNRLSSTASYQALIGQIESPTCPHCGNGDETAEYLLLLCQNGQQNASVTSVIRLTSQTCLIRTIKVWWNSSSLRDICPPPYRQRLTGSSWQQHKQVTWLVSALVSATLSAASFHEGNVIDDFSFSRDRASLSVITTRWPSVKVIWSVPSTNYIMRQKVHNLRY